QSEISVLQVEKRIRTHVKRQIEKGQREYYLNEQMKAIQKELGDEEGRSEVAEIEDKIKKTRLSKEAREKAQHLLAERRLHSRREHHREGMWFVDLLDDLGKSMGLPKGTKDMTVENFGKLILEESDTSVAIFNPFGFREDYGGKDMIPIEEQAEIKQ